MLRDIDLQNWLKSSKLEPNYYDEEEEENHCQYYPDIST